MKYFILVAILFSFLGVNGQATGAQYTPSVSTQATAPIAVQGKRPANAKEWYYDNVNGKWRAFRSYAEASNWLPANQKFPGVHAYVDSTGTLSGGVITGGLAIPVDYVYNSSLVLVQVPSGGVSTVTQSGTGAVPLPITTKLNVIVAPEDFGANGFDNVSDQVAFERALAYLKSIGGGTLLCKPGANYKLTNSLAYSRYITISGNRSSIEQTNNTKSIFVPDSSLAFVQHVTIENFILKYTTQTTSASNVGAVVLSKAGLVSWYITIKEIEFQKCDNCIDVPSVSGANSFLVNLENLGFDNPFGYGIRWLGDPQASGTNVSVKNCWVNGFAGYINNTQGFAFKGISGLHLENAVFQTLKNTALSIETCTGTASNIYLEGQLAGATFGVSRTMIDIINSDFNIGSIATVSPTIAARNANVYLLNIQNDYTARYVHVGSINEGDPVIEDTAANYNYYVARLINASGKGAARIDFYSPGNTDSVTNGTTKVAKYIPKTMGDVSIGDGKTFIDNWNAQLSGYGLLTKTDSTIATIGIARVSLVQINDSTIQILQGGVPVGSFGIGGSGGTSSVTTYPTSSTPANPASGSAVVWFDGTYFRIKKNVGGVITQAIIY